MLHPYAIAFEALWRATADRAPDDNAPPPREAPDNDATVACDVAMRRPPALYDRDPGEREDMGRW